MNNTYSHKNEISSYLRNHYNEHLIKEEGCGFLGHIESAQTFRVPSLESLPTIKDYKLFYGFMKMPYQSTILEIKKDNGWLIYVIGDYLDTDECLVCLLLSKTDKGITIYGDLKVEMDSTGYEVTTKLELLDDDVNDRFAWTIFEFMVAVNTPNIKQIEIKAPKLINKKRRSKGKPELIGYKFLELGSCNSLSESTGAGIKKRMHWRRGHIRRLEDKTIWVKQSLIGNSSFIDKTYKL